MEADTLIRGAISLVCALTLLGSFAYLLKLGTYTDQALGEQLTRTMAVTQQVLSKCPHARLWS